MSHSEENSDLLTERLRAYANEFLAGSEAAEQGHSLMNEAAAALSLEQLKKGLGTHLALVDLMRAMRKHSRPSKYPDDVRAAWDECERVLGDELAAAIERQVAA